MRKYLALAFIQVLILAGCGGGGGGSGSGGSSGGSSGGGGQVIATAGPPNVEPIIVDQGPAALQNANLTAVNVAYVSVTVCVPGSTTSCQTVDHIQVDTGSSGLRILASALTITLPPVFDASNNPMAECLPFADGSSWGSLATADFKLPTSGESAASVNVQIIGDPNFENARPNGTNNPSNNNCPLPSEDTVPTFGANGILGMGPFAQDCGDFCVSMIPSIPMYYGCPTPVSAATCAAETATLAQQITNPVTLLATDNNGVIVELPAVGTAGTTTVSGSLVFGIGTQSSNNNALASGVTVLTADPNAAYITANYSDLSNTAYTHSYFDSGSNGVFVVDALSAINTCPSPEQGFYCPTSTLNFTGSVTGMNSASASTPFSVADAQTQFNNGSFAAFSNLGGTNSDSLSLDLGLAFFYGRNVYTAVEGATVGGNAGPFYAF